MNHIYLAIFLVSCSALAFQVSLVRLFSIYLWYHFAFMVISIAMLGIGSGGTLLSVFPKLKRASNMAAYAMLLGIAIIAGYIFSNYIPFDPVKLSWDRVQLVYIALYYVALAAPFFFSGLIIATALSNISEKSGLLYGSDLLGAGFGSLMVLGLLNIAGPEYAILIASTLAFISAFVIGEKKVKVFSIVLITINLCIILIHPDFINVRISPYKSLSLSLKYPGAEHLKTYHSPFSRIDTLKSPAVRFAPGLSLRYLEPLPEQIGFSIDGGEMNAITKAKDKESLRFLEFLPSALCYEIGKRDDVLIIEPKGGLQALMAEYYGSKEIHKVENNPVVIKIIQNEFSKFSGKIFEKDTWTGLGRSYLINKNVKYDIIDLPMTGTSTAASFGISEDYRFTVEAFQEYLNHLKEDGLMSISLYLIPPPRIELRLLTTIATALEERGVKDVSSHIAAIRSWGSIIILVKNSPITLKEINGIKDFSKDRRFDLIHYPEIKDEETNIYVKMPSNEYFTAFKNILNPETRRLFIKDYLFDITPVHDENPFFHYYLRLKNIKAIYEVMGGKWQYFIEEGYLLPIIFVQVLILSFILILLPGFSKKHMNNPPSPPFSKGGMGGFVLLPYFAFLGLGFMLVEVSLIQKTILPLENPPYAVATVLTSILISSGIGSLLSHRFLKLRTPYLLLTIAVLIFAYSLLLSSLLSLISPHALELKMPAVFISLIPLGLLMGIPFPMGIKILGERNAPLIPWAWAINGCFSVLAPILTIMLAMAVGFKVVLWFGALTYILAFVSLRSFLSKISRR